MKNTVFDYVGNLDTLLAVVIGALLATIGALVAEIIQDKRNRKRRERDAARFFGDILSSLDRVLDFTFRSQTFGDPWGNTTVRLFKTALRETQIYERNRERLFEIRNSGLRNRIHSHFLKKTFPIEPIIESCDRAKEIKKLLNSGKGLSKNDKQNLTDELAQIEEWLETGLNAIKRERANTASLCQELGDIANIKFELDDSYSEPAATAPSTETTDQAD